MLMDVSTYVDELLDIWGVRVCGRVDVGGGIGDLVDEELRNLDIGILSLTEWIETLIENGYDDEKRGRGNSLYAEHEKVRLLVESNIAIKNVLESQSDLFCTIVTAFHRLQKLIKLQYKIDYEVAEERAKKEKNLLARVAVLEEKAEKLKGEKATG